MRKKVESVLIDTYKNDNELLRSDECCAIIISAAEYVGLFVLPKNGKSGMFDAIGTDACKIKNIKKEGRYYVK